MGRPKRIWYPGATYHLMGRGVRRMIIFQTDDDYIYFKQLLHLMAKKFNCRLHAYCLMSNHFHLLLETGETELWKFMRALCGNYAIQFNYRYSYKGHVFENRYKSCIVKNDEYFLQTSRYIHLNPVKAKMVFHPEDYPWSSYTTILGIKDDGLTDRDKTLAYFGKSSIYGYREFVEDISHKYVISENEIKKSMGENDLWLPW